MRLIADRLAAVRGLRTIFSGISFEVAGSEVLLLTGPNGAGKTTLIRMIAGFIRPAEGEVRLDGGRAGCALSEECHYVGHLNGVKLSLSVAENAAFWHRYLGGEAGRMQRAMAAFGLSNILDLPAGYLSAGQRRRLGLARLLLAHRPVWLLDEPTVSLDRDSQDALSAAVETHLAGGGLVVAATHVPLGFARSRELVLGDSSLAA